jgi:inner membrane protein
LDTITQALLGGSVGYVVAGKISPRKAVLCGATVAILPDLDVLIPYINDLDAFTLHRSWTHSWLVQTLITPALTYCIYKLDNTFRFVTWFWLTWLALITHSGLDALTVYGTQLFWPFLPSPVSGGSVFIIDPMYSVPLLAGFIAILIKPNKLLSHRILLSGFVFSCAYLLAGLFIQNWVEQQANIALQKQGIEYDKVLIAAAPLNIALWRALVINDDYYYQGFRSVFDQKNNFNFSQYARHSELTPLIASLPALQRLDWFTHGFYSLEQRGNTIVARDLRMGIEPSYIFNFAIAERNQQQTAALSPQRVEGEQVQLSDLKLVWQRIWNQDVQLNYHQSE